MGSGVSKSDSNTALLLCKDRTRFIKQAIESRYALSAAHLAYIQSLRSTGTALRRFVEAEVLVDSCLSTSEADKSPSHSSYASPSPSRIPEHVGSLSYNGSPFTPRQSNVSYMRAAGSNSVKLTFDSPRTHFVEEEESLTFPMPPPPPPLPEIGSSWDFFDPIDVIQGSGYQHSENGLSPNCSKMSAKNSFKEEELRPGTPNSQGKSENSRMLGNGSRRQMMVHPCSVNGTPQTEICEVGGLKPECGIANGSDLAEISVNKEKVEVEKELRAAQREDPADFITHRAKGFLSSIKDIEHRFTRAAESAQEVSRMLETSKIRLGICSEPTGTTSASMFLSAFHLLCCKVENVPDHDAAQHVTKVITWNRSVSSRSSSSKNPLTTASKDDNAESGSDFIEEFCMISGSHSSTLDRLYAWERKLYDEVKASVSVRKAYDQKCAQLRHQFARDLNVHVIDKTRAVVKDLHSQVTVAIQAVDSISKRIEKLRDEELQPQLLELIQGLIRMSKAMLECHHAQFITISLAYLAKNSASVPKGESYWQALIQLRTEMDCLGHSFGNWVNAHKSYIEALNTWLQKCVLLPQERARGRKFEFSPGRALAPPIFVLCRDWLAGMCTLPSKEVLGSIEGIVSGLRASLEHRIEEKHVEKKSAEVVAENNGDAPKESTEGDAPKESTEEEKYVRETNSNSNLTRLQTSLTTTFDQMSKFMESSLKVFEAVKLGTETARAAYIKGRFR